MTGNRISFATDGVERGSVDSDGWNGWIKGYDPTWKTATIGGQTITYLGR